jgi:AraC family transcriptional regulator, regulatory protein of adaptative response / DNA-3-methyladenine glycosylase II
MKADLSRLSMTRARIACLKALAEAAAKDRKLLEPAGDYESAVARVLALPGWGAWTVQYWALRALRDADAFPESDVGLLRSPAVASGNGRLSPKALLARAESWRPWRAYAAQHLWTHDAETRGRAHA